MLKTAESVSLGHPDKISDYISSYILDRMIEQDSNVKYAVEVMVKDNTVVLGGEVTGNVDLSSVTEYVKSALREIGYDERYADIWGDYAININKIRVINMVGIQSPDINRGVVNDGWGDQGVFVGYACRGDDLINRELYLARRLNRAVYDMARTSDNLGLDIKTQISIDEHGIIDTAILAVPMLNAVDLTQTVIDILGQVPRNIIINGTGIYRYHSSIADCGITGRKLACDFYSTACPIGGGSPWTKDGSKADLTLNLFARHLAIENLGDNDECFVYLSSCIGRSELPSGLIKTVKNGITTERDLYCVYPPRILIKLFGLDMPVYTKLCRDGITQKILQETKC
ncbi:MAG: methionine adenosyltransferase domain-containing protein [Alphaproteobacteria bacterium]|nr:methionine adenosyltransferase domain-containing protein [Alphaproteobacteria bacterium]MBR6598025.1 methionine adenosyltransferase domain-containing protein [Alphaproteobacteria bacterium]